MVGMDFAFAIVAAFPMMVMVIQHSKRTPVCRGLRKKNTFLTTAITMGCNLPLLGFWFLLFWHTQYRKYVLYITYVIS